MATYSSILAQKIPWTEEPGDYSLWDCKELDKTYTQTTIATMKLEIQLLSESEYVLLPYVCEKTLAKYV